MAMLDLKHSLSVLALVGAAVALSAWKKRKCKSRPAPRSILDLMRKNILALEPYRCARDDYSDGILLDANENSFGPPLSLAQYEVSEIERYPDPLVMDLKNKVAKYRGVRPEQIFVGVGSDEAIDLIIRIFCIPGGIDEILITPPTYGMYKVCAAVNDVRINKVPLTPDFDVDVDKTLNAVTPATKLLFLCSPGNPTSKMVPLPTIERILNDPRYDGMVVVDEAYIDFSTKPGASQLVGKYPKLIVLQTLSKAFGLAGIRCGMALGDTTTIDYMNRVKAPYNVNKLTESVASKAMDCVERVEATIAVILKERERVAAKLKKLPFVGRVFDSDANFIIFQADRALELYKTMADNGLVVRYRGNEIHCASCLRVSIGRPMENDQFLKRIEETYRFLTGG